MPSNLIAASFRALRSLFAPGMFGLFIVSVGVTIAALVGFVMCSGLFFSSLAAHLHGYAYLTWIGTLGAGVIAWFLFPGIMPVIVNFFDNRIASIIEERDYPSKPVQSPAFWPELLHDAQFSGLTILLNIVVLPLYLVPVINLVLFYILNGYLLGREFFVMAARRHISVHEAESLRKRHAKTVMIAGMMLTVLATIPIVNLFAPFWGIAVMVHLYHRLSSV